MNKLDSFSKKIILVIIVVLALIGAILFAKLKGNDEKEPNNVVVNEPVKVTDISIDQDDIYLMGNEELELSYTYMPNDAEIESVKWQVADESICVIEDNILKPVSSGDTTISLVIDGVSTSKEVSIRFSDYYGDVPEKLEGEGFTYIQDTLIANKTYSLPKDYDPGKILPIAQKAFDAMVEAAKEDGVSLWICSGYRSYSYQKGLYQKYVDKSSVAEADTYSARAGHSEHQTGLGMDLNKISYSWGETKEGKWVADHCHEYGFIIRYPESKQEQTGYRYEPWHVRYLGTKLAFQVYESGLCLEEYFNIDSKYAD